MNVLFVILLLIATNVCWTFSMEPRFPSFGYVEVPQRRSADIEFGKRFLPIKERRAPLDGFEDMSGFLRTIDGIQKPRFGK